MSEVRAFKLVGGDEIVAEVVETQRDAVVEERLDIRGEFIKGNPGNIKAYTLRRPHILQFQSMPGGGVGLAFVPWTLSNPSIESIDVPVHQVIAAFEPAERVARQYLEQTSGITIATTPMSQRIST